MDLHAAVPGKVAADPFAIVVAEGRAGDDREAILGEARDGEVALDPAAAVEHLRVGDLLRLAGHPVVAQALEELRRPGSLDLHLRERGLVEDRHALPRGLVLGADRRGPVLAGPAPRAQRLVSLRGVRLVPVDPLPTRLLAERCLALAMPGGCGRDAQRPPGAALVVRVADVVVGLVGLLDPGVGVGRRAVLGAEATDVHLPEVEAGLALGDPLGHHLADPPGAGQPVGAEAGGDEQPGDLGLAEAELVVGRERLRPVDQLRHLDLVHRRHPPLRVLGDLLEAIRIVLEQAAVEVGRDAVEAAGPVGQERRRAAALVAAHHQARAVLAVVDEQVGVAQGRQPPLTTLAKWLRDHVLVRHRDHGHANARHAADLRRVHAARVDHHLGLDRRRARCERRAPARRRRRSRRPGSR